MNTNLLALASGLSDLGLSRAEVTAFAHGTSIRRLLPAFLYAAQGYGSLFSYCTHALRLSEDATCNRIEAARACRSFPVILEHLTSGAMSLTSVRLLRRHLTPENHEAVLARACGRSRREIEALVAELAPRPDVPTSVRKLPIPSSAPTPMPMAVPTPTPCAAAAMEPTIGTSSEPASAIAAPPPLLPTRRPIVQATSPDRYRVQFTIGKDSHDKLRRVQTLLRREIPDGDPGAIFDRALTLLLESVERTKRAAAAKPRPARSTRPGTDRQVRTPILPSRDIPRGVKRAAARRDRDQCAFVSKDGQRCTERTFLEFHHIRAYAQGGLATVENISLRCRRHNQYEGELVFGRKTTSRRPPRARSQATRE